MKMLVSSLAVSHGRNQNEEPNDDFETNLRMLASTDECRAYKPKGRKSLVARNLRKSLTKSFTKMMIGKDEESSTTSPRASFASDTSSDPNQEVLKALVGQNAVHYLQRCFSTEVNILDKEKFEGIPEFHKSELKIGRHLGKGVYSDVFEVGVVVPVFGQLNLSLRGDFGIPPSKDTVGKPLFLHDTSDYKAVDTTSISGGKTMDVMASIRRKPSHRRSSFCSSTTLSTTTHGHTLRPANCDEHNIVYAMKCLRPCIRSDKEQFMIGAEDLVHETAMLASIDHPNIIKLHGRAGGELTDAFKLNDGYFILLDKLNCTLEDRLEEWKAKREAITSCQVEVAHAIASALSHLHSMNVVFRDLKPANVGFDNQGIVKLFDFGFAISIPDEGEGMLYDRCGTLRYMAPEIGLSLGYGLRADTYSFGIILWQMHALKKPFQFLHSAEKFEQRVFYQGIRPQIDKNWDEDLKDLMSDCWSHDQDARPSMMLVKSILYSKKNQSEICRSQKKYTRRSARHLSINYDIDAA